MDVPATPQSAAVAVRRTPLRVGTFISITKSELQAILDQLQAAGYRTIGPQVADAAVVYGELSSVEQLPIGWLDQQDGGRYRLERSGEAWFDYVVGPHSLKNYLFPPRDTLVQLERRNGSWQVETPDWRTRPLAVLGLRSCDLHALTIQDRVFLGDRYVDPAYAARRADLFVVAVNCRRAAATCFCHSMQTGPACKSGFDLALTELPEVFVIEVGSERGGETVAAIDWRPATRAEIELARQLTRALEQELRARASGGAERSAAAVAESVPAGRSLDTRDLHQLLMDNLEHPRWDEVAERCLACANCTLVCPTCFCSHVDEVSDLSGDQVRRERTWASCFTAEHSYMNSGTVRKTTRSRYRQWLTHKLATWYDQFGSSGCVGCGRCITWCPVGIDLTEEVAAIRGTSA